MAAQQSLFFRGDSKCRIGRKDQVETQRAAALVHQLPACRDSRREPRRVGGGNLSANDLSPLSRTGDAGAGENVVFNHAGSWGEDRSPPPQAIEECVNSYTLRFSKPVSLTGDWNYGDRKLSAAQHRGIKTRRQAIRRKLRREITLEERGRLTDELLTLVQLETQILGVKHRDTSFPLGKD